MVISYQMWRLWWPCFNPWKIVNSNLWFHWDLKKILLHNLQGKWFIYYFLASNKMYISSAIIYDLLQVTIELRFVLSSYLNDYENTSPCLLIFARWINLMFVTFLFLYIYIILLCNASYKTKCKLISYISFKK